MNPDTKQKIWSYCECNWIPDKSIHPPNTILLVSKAVGDMKQCEDYTSVGTYLFVYVTNTNEIMVQWSVFGHCSCYGPEEGCDPDGSHYSLSFLVECHEKQWDPKLAPRPLDVQDCDYDHVRECLAQVYEWFKEGY